MKVKVRRSGGFANIGRKFTIDSDDLDETGRLELERIVDAIRGEGAERARHPDAYRYRIEVDGEEYVVSESWITEALARLGANGSRSKPS